MVPLHSDREPTPTTLIGLHVRPKMTFRSLTSTPMALRTAAPAAELAYNKETGGQAAFRWVISVRTGSVVAQHAVVPVSWPPGPHRSR